MLVVIEFKTMKYLSLFSGIGGFELGIQQAYEELCIKNKKQSKGVQTRDKKGQCKQLSKLCTEGLSCIGYSEIDKYAIQVYNKHFNHKNYGDITKTDARALPDFDLLVGGFPCQSFSIAGKRGGFNDTRGTLFFDIARIAREKQPRLLLLENVKGLLSHDKGRTFFTIVSTLDELGYDVQWQVLNSKNFGVPQNRERVFIVGHLRGTSRPEVFPIGGTTKAVTCNKTIRAGGRGSLTKKHAWDLVKIKEATKKGYAEASIGDSINLSVPNSKTRRGRVGRGVAQTLDTGMKQYTLLGGLIRRLTPKECERLQGFPDNWTKYGILNERSLLVDADIQLISDTQRYKMCGNAVTVNVIKEIMLKIFQ